MNPIVKNILVFIAAWLVGSLSNMLVLQLGMQLIAPPEGFDLNTPEGLKAAMPLMEWKHFITPFLSHAIGTLVGAIILAKFAASNAFKLVMGLSFLFFLGGLAMVFMVPSPLAFTIIDLVFAYFPMGYLGYQLVYKSK
jgi:hypothetical protein